MTAPAARPVEGTRWRTQLATTAGLALLGVLVRIVSPFLPVQLVMILLGVSLVAAAFMLAWAADAGESVFSGGLVLAGIALVTVLPEFIIEIRFAFIQQVELVTANLTGATRLLLTGGLALPLFVGFLARRRGEEAPLLRLDPNRRLELGILLITGVFAIQIVLRGNLTIVDGVVLLALYAFYAWRVQGSPDEEPAVVGVAAGLLSLAPRLRRPVITALIVVGGAVVVVVANPFADALLKTGTLLGFDPYLLIQSVVPAATEAPEFVVVGVLVANRRPAQGLALFLASSLSQSTLALGSLPVAFMAGGGGPSMPLAGREQIELGFTIAVTFFVVAALITLRPERVDALVLTGVFVVQIVYPDLFVRFAAGIVLLVFALDLFLARWRLVPSLVRAVFGRRTAAGDRKS